MPTSKNGVIISGRNAPIDSTQSGSESCEEWHTYTANSLGNPTGSSTSIVHDKAKGSLGMSATEPRDLSVPKQVIASGDGTRTQSFIPNIDFDGLIRPSAGTVKRCQENGEQAALRLGKMEDAVRTLLECIGEDPNREGLQNTPSRYAKALLSLTRGYQVNVDEIINNALFCEGHNEMVIVKDIDIYSLCEHHLMPFTGKMHVGYIPSNTVIGLSKLPRIAEIFSCRLQIQERLTREVAQAIMKTLEPQGVAVVMESSHLCMVMRGVEKASATTLTSCVLGSFHHNSKTRDEFLGLIGVKR